MVDPRTPKPAKSKDLVPLAAPNPRTSLQGELALQIEVQREIDGVGMGVLTDGTPFLTGRGLARLCGVDSSRISEMATDWGSQAPKPMTARVRKILEDRGLAIPEHPYIEIRQPGEVTFHAYSDVVCLAVLEYYAFDAPGTKELAQRNFRLLGGKALHDLIYREVGYDPNQNVPAAWRQFHDRVSRSYDSVPAGYFGVFKEIADIVVTLGQAGLHIDSNFVPDISVGLAWGKYWMEGGLDDRYGQRKKWEHNYPEYFPQAASNPQQAWCYPEMALGEFRRWLREEYIGEGKFSNYISGKIRDRQLPPSFAQVVRAAYNLDGDALRSPSEMNRLPPPR